MDFKVIKVERVNEISLKLNSVNQLFNSFDPSPFIDKDLDKDAYEYIVSSAKEIGLHKKIKLKIFITKKAPEKDVKESIKNFFEYKKFLEKKKIKQKFIEGQKSLTIGLLFLITCLFLRELILNFNQNIFNEIFSEALIIMGWVAMWKPISNILYDWWPLKNEMKIFEKIANSEIEFVYDK